MGRNINNNDENYTINNNNNIEGQIDIDDNYTINNRLVLLKPWFYLTCLKSRVVHSSKYTQVNKT